MIGPNCASNREIFSPNARQIRFAWPGLTIMLLTSFAVSSILHTAFQNFISARPKPIAVPEWFDLYVGLEAAASRLFLYEQELVPGLFQTADYARTLITADHPEESDEETDRRVSLRMARQALVRRTIDPPRPTC